jgi:hypothetical protein
MTKAQLALAVPAVATALAVGHAATTQASTQTPERVIASAQEHALRIDIVAKETSAGSAPTASVWTIAYDHSTGVWRRLGEIRLGDSGGFFWKTVTGQHAIRDFTVSNSVPRGGSVRLLVTPALGWSPVYHFQLHNGRFVR